MFIINVIVFLKQTIITGIIYGMQIIVHKHKYLYEIGKCNTYSFQHREVHSRKQMHLKQNFCSLKG